MRHDTSDENERLPWCDHCEAFAVPTDDGECGDCGRAVTYRSEQADFGGGETTGVQDL